MPTPVEDLARAVHAEIRGDRKKTVSSAAPLDQAGPHDIAFAVDHSKLAELEQCRAGVIVISRRTFDGLSIDAAAERTFLLVDDPKTAFLDLVAVLRPARARPEIGISAQAFVSATARIGSGTNVYPGAYVGDDVVIGENCDVHSGVSIGPGCRIGNEVILYANVAIYADVEIGDRVNVHACAVLGADGFGYRFINGRHRKLPHLGTLRIENDVEIGAGTTIDRAMIAHTVIGEGTKIDNQVMVAHNCRVGRHNILVAQVGLAGSVTSEDFVICAGGAGVADHVHLGEGCVLGARSAVHKDVPAGERRMGAPALPEDEARRCLIAHRKLPEMRQQLRNLEKRVAQLCAQAEERDSQSGLKTAKPAA